MFVESNGNPNEPNLLLDLGLDPHPFNFSLFTLSKKILTHADGDWAPFAYIATYRVAPWACALTVRVTAVVFRLGESGARKGDHGRINK